MAPPSFEGSVADLFATLGLDDSSFSDGLRRAQVKLEMSATAMQRPIKEINGLLTQLAAQAGPTAANTALTQLAARAENARTMVARLQLQLQQGGNVPPIIPFGGDSSSGNGGGVDSPMLIARLTQRFLIYQGLRLAVRGVTEALQEADDITRRMDQSGWGSKGVQMLMSAAQMLGAPIETVTSSLARLNEKIDGGDLATIQTLDRLGLKYTTVRQQFASDPQGGFETIAKALMRVSDQGRLSTDMMTLFNDRSAKMLSFIKEWGTLKEEAIKNPMLTDRDMANIEVFNHFIDRIQTLGKVEIGKIVSGDSEAVTAIKGLMELGPMGSLQLLTTGTIPDDKKAGIRKLLSSQNGSTPSGATPSGGALGLGGAGGPSSSAMADVRRLLDEYRQPHEVAIHKMMEDVGTMQLLERQGVATHAQAAEFMQDASKKILEENQAQLDAVIRSDTALLNEFGTQGKHTTEAMSEDFSKLTRAFREGRIALEDMKEATANYYAMLEDQASRPGLTEAMKMFEQGMIGGDELNRARGRANALKGRTSAEEAFASGTGAFDYRLLGVAQTQYRRNLESNAPERYSMPEFLMGPSGTTSGRTITKTPTTPTLGGTLNIVPMDQFSNRILELWRQRGLGTP